MGLLLEQLRQFVKALRQRVHALQRLRELRLILPHGLVQGLAQRIHARGERGEVLHRRVQVPTAVIQQRPHLLEARLEIHQGGIQPRDRLLALDREALIGAQGGIQFLQRLGHRRMIQHHARALGLELRPEIVHGIVQVAQQLVRLGEHRAQAASGFASQHDIRRKRRAPLIRGRQHQRHRCSAESLADHRRLGALPKHQVLLDARPDQKGIGGALSHQGHLFHPTHLEPLKQHGRAHLHALEILHLDPERAGGGRHRGCALVREQTEK